MSKRLGKLDDAFELIRRSVDPGWWAVALVIGLMLGGFVWLSSQVSRIEAKVDALSLKVAETPGLFQRDLQAQADNLAALINADRHSGRATPSAGGVVPTQDRAPARPAPRGGTDLPPVVNKRLGATAGVAKSAAAT